MNKSKYLAIPILAVSLFGCGVWGPKEKFAFIDEGLYFPSEPDTKQLVVNVPTGKLDWNGYLAFFRHSDIYSVFYRKNSEYKVEAVKLLYANNSSNPGKEIKIKNSSKLSINNCSAILELYFENGSPITEINGTYNNICMKVNTK